MQPCGPGEVKGYVRFTFPLVVCFLFVLHFLPRCCTSQFTRIPPLKSVRNPGESSFSGSQSPSPLQRWACSLDPSENNRGGQLQRPFFPQRSSLACAPGNQKLPRVAGRSTVAPREHRRTHSKGRGVREKPPFPIHPSAGRAQLGGSPAVWQEPGRERERHAVLFKSSTFFAISPLAGWGYPPHRGRC